MQNLTLITGGARSGKSTLAERLGREGDSPVFYFATMHERPDDAEQCRRIERHQANRPAEWQTVVVNDGLASAIDMLPKQNALVIVDCLSLYVADFLMCRLGENARGEQVYEGEDPLMETLRADLLAMERSHQTKFVVVTNEVGSGVVPDHVLGRAYRDLLGAANQLFAAHAQTVYMMCVGIAVRIKPVS